LVLDISPELHYRLSIIINFTKIRTNIENENYIFKNIGYFPLKSVKKRSKNVNLVKYIENKKSRKFDSLTFSIKKSWMLLVTLKVFE
jgi:hypothetical protein